jgi:hypothetical protein
MRHDGQLRRRLPVSFVTLSRVRYGGVACLTARRGHILVQSACSRERRETVRESGASRKCGPKRNLGPRESLAAEPSRAEPSRAVSMKIAPLLGLLFLVCVISCLCYFFVCLSIQALMAPTVPASVAWVPLSGRAVQYWIVGRLLFPIRFIVAGPGLTLNPL